MESKDIIAQRAALELADGEVVNLGFGIPTAVANHIPKGINIILQSENGCLMFGPTPRLGRQDADVANAGGQPISLLPGASVFDLSVSFSIIRGGHVDTTILGALEVDQQGNIANWAMPVAPGRYAPGMGGAMDLVGGARKVVAVLQHADKHGRSKVLKQCSLPLTGRAAVDVIITDKAVFRVTPEGLLLTEVLAGLTVDDIRSMTDADFQVAPDLCEYRVQ
jgi:3-oxoacid CoA-transferase B subunit